MTWEIERAKDFFRFRQQLVANGPGTVCKKSTTRGVLPYFPFNGSNYPHVGLLPTWGSSSWVTLRDTPPADLIVDDPFKSSTVRKGKLAVWDAVIGIPAPDIRPAKEVHPRQVVSVRPVNTTWRDVTLPELNRVTDGAWRIRRPELTCGVDFATHPQGWRFREAAHVLSHMRNTRGIWSEPGYTDTQFDDLRCIGEIAACVIYDLPLDVGLKVPGEADFTQYGISVKASSMFRLPTLRVPMLNREAPKPDAVIAYLAMAVFLEPQPYGVAINSPRWLECNRWSCSSSNAYVAGWELVDVITHQALCASRPGSTVSYGMNPADLLPPETFWAYLAQARVARGEPLFDNVRYWRVEDWIASDHYRQQLMRTPPLPCRTCMSLNMRTEGAPQRPEFKRPETPRSKWRRHDPDESAWLEWEETLDRAFKIIKRATIAYENTVNGGHRAATARRWKQTCGYSQKMTTLKTIAKLERLAKRARLNGNLTKAGETDKMLAQARQTLQG